MRREKKKGEREQERKKEREKERKRERKIERKKEGKKERKREREKERKREREKERKREREKEKEKNIERWKKRQSWNIFLTQDHTTLQMLKECFGRCGGWCCFLWETKWQSQNKWNVNFLLAGEGGLEVRCHGAWPSLPLDIHISRLSRHGSHYSTGSITLRWQRAHWQAALRNLQRHQKPAPKLIIRKSANPPARKKRKPTKKKTLMNIGVLF